MKQSTIKKWQDGAVADLKKYRDMDDGVGSETKVQFELWKLRVYQHKINDLCAMLLPDVPVLAPPMPKVPNINELMEML